jgi:hypothetical protein
VLSSTANGQLQSQHEHKSNNNVTAQEKTKIEAIETTKTKKNESV